MDGAAQLIDATLKEETDSTLTSLADALVNEEAMAEG